MNRRLPRFLIPVLLISILLIVGAIIVIQERGKSLSTATYPPDVVKVAPFPTPNDSRTTYINHQFGYAITYPTTWSLGEVSPAKVEVKFIAGRGYPEAVAFDIRCAANPSQLDAQTWWTQHAGPNQKPIGPFTLQSSVSAFLAVGHGQGNFYTYTLTHDQTACEIVSYPTDAANARVVEATINTFQWQ